MVVSPLRAETLTCENSLVSVISEQTRDAEMVCEAVGLTTVLFDQYNVPALLFPLRIQVVEEMKDGCVALYHCGEDRIEILEPPLMETRRDPDGAFTFLPINEYFRSVVVHELAHAASDGAPCPFGICVVRDEYVAYAMQVMFLTSDAQLEFAAIAELERPISRDELSSIMLFIAPNLFAQKVWTHLTQRDDPRGFIGQLSEGKVILDRERF